MSEKIFVISESSWLIDGDADVQTAREMRETLLSALDATGPDAPVSVDLSTNAPTAPAIQLVHAARRSLENRGAFAGFGPCAASLLIA